LGLARREMEAELERHHADCHGWALGCCGGDRHEADDVLQSSYLKVLDGRAAFDGRSSFRTWLFAVVRRTAAEHRRRRLLRRLWPLHAEGDGGPPEPADPAPDAAAAVGHAETSERLRRALSALPRRQRELLHLVFYEELSISEAAEVIGVSIGSARTHYERGKRRMRELLGTTERDP
jgi:RNA polymerase sigma factor (sigma-70 family)